MSEISKALLDKLNAGREYRQVNFAKLEIRSEDNGHKVVDGYATTFNQPYELYRCDGYIVQEQIDSRAFDECDMSDVIFQLNHTGRVYARTRNKTLALGPDDHGLHTLAELSGTVPGQQLFEEIKGGYYDRMSMGFVVLEDTKKTTVADTGVTTILRTITKIKKLYDVSVVSFPANEDTEISARHFGEGVIAEAKKLEQQTAQDKEKREKQRESIRQLLKERSKQ